MGKRGRRVDGVVTLYVSVMGTVNVVGGGGGKRFGGFQHGCTIYRYVHHVIAIGTRAHGGKSLLLSVTEWRALTRAFSPSPLPPLYMYRRRRHIHHRGEYFSRSLYYTRPRLPRLVFLSRPLFFPSRSLFRIHFMACSIK